MNKIMLFVAAFFPLAILIGFALSHKAPAQHCLITICNAQDECKEIQADLVNGKMNIEFEKGYMPTGARCK